MKRLVLCMLVVCASSYARQVTITDNEDAIWTVELRWREKGQSIGVAGIAPMVNKVKTIKVLPTDLGPKARIDVSGANISFSPGNISLLALPQGFVAIKITKSEVAGVARTEKDSRGRTTGAVVYREGSQIGSIWSGCLRGNGDVTIDSLEEPIFSDSLQLAPDGRNTQCQGR